jgi:sodium/proline symporter
MFLAQEEILEPLGGPAVVVFLVYLAAVISLGLWYAKISRTLSRYYVGGRSLNAWIVSMSFQATTNTAGSALGFASFGMLDGYSVLWWALGDSGGQFVTFATIGRRLRRFSQIVRAYTFPEFFEKRYGWPSLRVVAAVVVSLFLVVYGVIQMRATGIVLELTFGWDYTPAVLIGGAVVIAYVVAGGFLAVAYTDFIQALVMIASFLVLMFLTLDSVGGFAALNEQLFEIDPEFVSPWGPGEFYKSIPILAGAILTFSGLGYMGQPQMVIRIYAARTTGVLKRAALIGSIWASGWVILTYFLGIMAIAVFADMPVVQETLADDPDLTTPTLIRHILPTWLAAIAFAAIIAAVMSSFDSFLLMIGQAFTRDIVARFWRPDMTGERQVLWTRVVLVFVGILVVIVSLRPPLIIFDLLVVAWGSLAVAFAPVLIGGLFSKRVTPLGAMMSMILGPTALVISSPLFIDDRGNHDWHEFFIGLIVSVTALIIGSRIGKPTAPEPLDNLDRAVAIRAPAPAGGAQPTKSVSVPKRKEKEQPRLTRGEYIATQMPALRGWLGEPGTATAS